MNLPSARRPQTTRLACNRCHQQKLRCHRSPVPGQPCARCENAQAQCIFAPPLRPGRPSSGRRSRPKATTPAGGLPLSSTTSSTSRSTSTPTSTSTPPSSALSDLDGLFDLHLTGQCTSSGPDDALLALDVNMDPALYETPDWLESVPGEVETHSFAPIRHHSPSATSVPSSPPSHTTHINFYHLSELSMTLHEYCQALGPNRQASMANRPPTIDQILAVTQSLIENLAPFTANTLSPLPPSPARPVSPDAATILLILSCYLRLLHLYNTALPTSIPTLASSTSTTTASGDTYSPPAPTASTGPQQTQSSHFTPPLHFQLGCFSAPIASSTLLACLSSQLLSSLESTLRALSSTQSTLSKAAAAMGIAGDTNTATSGPGGAVLSSVTTLLRAALGEARSLRGNVSKQLSTLNQQMGGGTE